MLHRPLRAQWPSLHVSLGAPYVFTGISWSYCGMEQGHHSLRFNGIRGRSASFIQLSLQCSENKTEWAWLQRSSFWLKKMIDFSWMDRKHFKGRNSDFPKSSGDATDSVMDEPYASFNPDNPSLFWPPNIGWSNLKRISRTEDNGPCPILGVAEDIVHM